MIKKWKVLKEELIDLGWRKLYRRIYLLQDGKEREYIIKKEPVVVCMVPITKDNKVVLTKQYRPGPDKILLELPGGGVEEGETPEDAAKRELLEETGYSGEIKYVGPSVDSAYSTMKRHNYVFVNCEKIAEQNLDDTEFIEVLEMSLKEFREHLRGGQLTDVETGYLGLDFLGLL